MKKPVAFTVDEVHRRFERFEVEAFVNKRRQVVDGIPAKGREVLAVIGKENAFPFSVTWHGEDERLTDIAGSECCRRHRCSNGRYLSEMRVLRKKANP